MTKLLIATRPDDVHAVYVKLALNQLGHAADILYTADYPSKLAFSFNIKQDHFSWNHQEDYDVIWYRRPAKPQLPTYIHPDDAANAKKENDLFIQSMWQTVFPNAVWLNPIASSIRANSKLLQLKLADSIKLKIPETLISNNPQAIKKFISQQATIYKTLYPMAWINSNEVRLTYSDVITLSELPSDRILKCTPGIFQQKVEKQHELRITYFGEHYIAVKIDSQNHRKARADWRYASINELHLEKVQLPDHIDLACRTLMKQLNIVFGSFDFIVTPDNEYYFLEINEQGQFLWIEDNNPDIKMLEAFIHFVLRLNIGQNEAFKPIHLADYKKDMMYFVDAAMKNHVNPPLYYQ